MPPPLLPVWMNVASLNLWLLDFHTIQFSDNTVLGIILRFSLMPFCCANRQSVLTYASSCLLYTSDAADDWLVV